MKKIIFSLLVLASSTSSFAQDPVIYANPKQLYLSCEPIITYGNINDDWTLTIAGLEASFFDNDSSSYGKYVGVEETGGGSRYFQYEGFYHGHWKFYLNSWILVPGKKEKIFGTLKFNLKSKDQAILECKIISKKEAKEQVKYAKEEMNF